MANKRPLVLIDGVTKELSSDDTLLGKVLADTLSVKNTLGTVTSTLLNNNSATRQYTFPNKDITVAGLEDISTLTPISEVPSGTLNGVNTVFTLSQTPFNAEVIVTLNGLKQKKTVDYSISGLTITFVVAPDTDISIEAFYLYTSTSTFVSNVFSYIPVRDSVTGITPLLISRFTLPAGTYTEFKAVIGSALSTTIASLEIKKSDGTVLKTLTRTGTPLEVTTTGFTLVSDTLISIYLKGDLSTTISYIFSLGIK